MVEMDNTGILVTKFNECFHFYSEVLGFNVKWGGLDSGYASFDAGKGKIIAIFDRYEMAEAVGTSSLPAYREAQDNFALILRVKEDLEKVVEHLQKNDVSILQGIQDRPDWGIRTVHLRDPDGNLIEIVANLAEEKWNKELLEEDKKYRDA